MKLFIRLLLIIIWHFAFTSTANDIYFHRLGLKDGLSQINIMSIYQDEFGAMWFGTTEGINRYNGKQIETFKNGISQNTIYSILGNKSGAIYIHADNDLIRYDISKQKFDCIKQKISTIAYADSMLWVIDDKEISTYDEKSGEFSLYMSLSEDISGVTAILPLKNGDIWVGTRKGLIKISKNNLQQTIIENENINNLYKDKNQNIWVATFNDGVYLISPDGNIKNFRHHPTVNSVSNNQIRYIIEDDGGKIWVGTFFGLNQYDPQTGLWKKYINQDHISHSISHSSVFALYKDIQGTIWVGTYFGGVNYFNQDIDIFRYYGASSTNSDYLSFPFVSKMTEDNHNNLWICTEGGALNCLNLTTRRFSRYMFNENQLESADYNNQKCIWYREGKELLYIGIHNGGLSIFDIKTKKNRIISADPHKAHSLPNNTINKMQYYNGELILLTQSGLVRMDLESELFYPFSDNPFISGVLAGIGTHTFYIDSKDRLWFNAKGIICIDLKTNQIKSYKSEEYIQNNSNRGLNASDFFENKSGEIFWASTGSGIFKFDEEKDLFINYTEEDGLKSNYCYSISESPSGKLILLFNKGFSFFNPHQPNEELFSSSPNFPLIGFNFGSSVYITKNDEIFIGGVNGLVSFFEKDLDKTKENISIYFDKLYVNNKLISPNDESKILNNTLPLCSKVNLDYQQNNISIDFASSNYLRNTDIKFEYKLEGFDKDWIVTERQTITYTNLNAGDYTLMVRQATVSDNSNAHIYTLDIEVTPPFYLSKVALCLYVILLIISTVGIFRFYSWRTRLEANLKMAKQEKESIEKLNQTKLRFFTNISHEFRTPLTLITSQAETLLSYSELSTKAHNKIKKIQKNVNHLQNLITELLDFRKQEQGYNKLNISKTELTGYIKNIYESFYDYASKRNIKFNIEYPELPIYVYIDPKQFQKAIYNLLSNALKYTSDNGEISIKIYQNLHQIKIQITDTGIGIPQESLTKIFDRFYQLEYRSSGLTLGTGIGLALTQEIIHAHKGEINVESTVNKGSIFTISLYTGTAHFNPEDIINEEDYHSQYFIEDSPVDTDYNAVSSPLSDTEDQTDPANKPSVLLVDDNEELLSILTESFSTHYVIHTATDGEKGLEKALEIQPDIIISDIMMPNMNGKEMCYRIKNNINTSHIPVILLTAQTSDNQKIDGYMYGADAYITKPFNIKILISHCNNILKNRRLLFQNFAGQSTEVPPTYNTVTEQDRLLIDKATNIIKDNFGNPEFDMNKLSNELGMGRSKLYIKIKEITGFTPNEFTLNLKLQEAAHLLKTQKQMNISDIAFHLGFSSSKYFSKCFKSFYGVSPLDWRKENN